MSIRITCINKSNGWHQNPHEAIAYLNWTDEQTGQKGRISRVDLYNWLESRAGSAYVKDARGNLAYVGTVISALGTHFVRTYADRVWTDNLLSLPECR